jgi:hypothetical protein
MHGAAMTQQPLFIPTESGERLPVPTLPLARNTDPATSKEAAASLAGSTQLGQAQLDALCLVRAYPGRTANELARAAGHGDPRKVNRRLIELKRVDLIEVRGSSVDAITHKRGLRWWPK